MASHSPSHPDMSLGLALAVISSSTAPVLLLDGNLKLVAASKSFCSAFGIDGVGIADKSLSALGAGEWNVPQFNSLLKATLSGSAVEGYEMMLRRSDQPDRHLRINAQKLAYGEHESVRLLVTISDVTDTRIAEREKEGLLRDKALLYQELQHRVANSLQIIASVLMQGARNVQSEEARGHLNHAHQRVMSVASLQHQLAASSDGDVKLRPYFTSLCESIGSSMIHDHNQLSLNVTVDDSVTSGDTSVSLGLIVTELVINALKHAFPDGRRGKITVDYCSRGLNWVLAVTDDGVGMPGIVANSKPGLGTSIISALSTQLNCVIKISDAHPGTAVYVTHTHLSVVANDAKSGSRAV